tara:strand:- start:3638 stop:4819 length:1182 start_codon:yes stop_codon:yes gene_type:complete
MSYEDTSLYNLMLAALSAPKRGFHAPCFGVKNKSFNKIVDREVRTLRADLIGAQRFIVQPSLMRHAAMASLVPPERLLDMFSVGRPCFDNLWIEWEDARRVPILFECMEEMGMEITQEQDPSQWVAKIGFHITSNEPHGQGWLCQQYALIDGKIGSPEWAVNFTCDEPFDRKRLADLSFSKRSDTGFESHGVSATDIEDMMGEQGPLLIGAPYTKHWSQQRRRPMTDVFHRVTMTLGTFSSLQLKYNTASVATHADQMKVHKDSQQGALLAWTGDIRYLMAVLALVNYPHTVVERDQIETKLRSMAWGQRVPRNEVRLLDIDLPKPRGTTRYEKMFKGGGAPKRRHVRRGHWRRLKHKDGTFTTKWIEEQWVGNADLGTIIHDYNLKSKENRA